MTLEPRITKEQVMEHILSSKELDCMLTNNGFSIGYGFDEDNLPTKCYYGNEGDMIEECLKEIIDFYKKYHTDITIMER